MITIDEVLDTYHSKSGMVSTITRIYSILTICIATFLFANGFVTFEYTRDAYKIFTAFLACDVMQYMGAALITYLQYKRMDKKGEDTASGYYSITPIFGWIMFILKFIFCLLLTAQVFFCL